MAMNPSRTPRVPGDSGTLYRRPSLPRRGGRRLGLVLATLGVCFAGQAADYTASKVIPPAPMREFRGAWVATVGNIDWPSRKGLSTQDQKAELLAILDRAAQLKLNAIIFQVQPGLRRHVCLAD